MPQKNKSFEEKLAELEEIVSWFESEEVTLDKSVAKFEKGMKLAKDLEDDVESAQLKINVIKEKFDKA